MAASILQSVTQQAANTVLHPYSNAQSLESKSSAPPQYEFTFTPFLRSNALTSLASTVPVCPNYAASPSSCPLGRRCPNRHPTPSQTQTGGGHGYHNRTNDNFVCKHWLKGLCKKGDSCDYLHEYNLRKMSECQFYNQNGYCQNGDECLYVHVKEESKLPRCEQYDAGLCIKGPTCEKRHVRRKLCEFYLAGFCPEGKDCQHGVHLKAGGPVNATLADDGEARRRDRLAEFDRREDDNKKDFGWKSGRGGRGGGRWRNKRDRK